MQRLALRLVLVICVALAAFPVFAQSTTSKPFPAVKAAAVDAVIEAEMKRQQLVGVAVGILQNGEIAYLKGYGQADREKQTPVTTQTVFNWASNSKPLAAVAAMQLVDQKLLDLDADVRKYVPEFPDKGAVITARHLLTHQSGIPHYSNGEVIPTLRQDADAQALLDPIAALDRFNRSPLLFKPGEKTSYSSYAFVLLSAVIQRAGKNRFDDQVQERIAKPLSIKSLQLDVESKDQRDWAAGYTKNDDDQVVLAAEEANYWKYGAGGYKSNIGDFARWAEALINRKLVSEEAQKQMWTRQNTAAGDVTNRGLGFILEDQGGLRVSHGGKQREVTTQMIIFPQARHGIVVMCNCGYANIGELSAAVFSALNRTEAETTQKEVKIVENSIGMKLVLVPAGEFMMGKHETLAELTKIFPQYGKDRVGKERLTLADELPLHRVRITRPFYFGQHEVTVANFRKFVESGYTPESIADGTGGYGYDPQRKVEAGVGEAFAGRDPRFSWLNPGFKQGEDHPVTNVTWKDAQAMCKWLSEKEGKKYRLPTEAEWEYACRAGTRTLYHNGNDLESLVQVANLYDADTATNWPQWKEYSLPGHDGFEFTSPVGKFAPNAFGLHDMHGNVWEWCSDYHADDYYAQSPIDDPQGPETGTVRVRRGGSWHTWPLYVRSSYRNWNSERTRYALLGMRLVREE